MKKTKAIILAAGGGTRMKSKKAKVIHEILGKTLVQYVIESARQAGADEICVVVGHQKEEVMASIGDGVTFVTQEELLGTGHAVMQAGDFIEDEGQVLVLFGDTPLITSDTLKAMVDYTLKSGSQVTVLSTIVDEPAGYGRIIRDIDQNFLKSVEHKDASESELMSHEINSGMYCFDSAALKASLGQLSNNNAQGEYYLPDTLEIIMADGGKAQALVTSKSDEILGINTKEQLAEAAEIIRMRINESGETVK